MDFEHFFTSAFEQADVSGVLGDAEGQNVNEIIEKINGFDYWMQTFLKALKDWEAALRAKNKLSGNQVVLYTFAATKTNLFGYVYLAEEGPGGMPVITQEVGRFAYKDYMNKLKEGIEYMRPYLESANKVILLNAGNNE